MNYLLSHKTFENYTDFPNLRQTKEYNCGPTALLIILNFLKYPSNISESYLEDITGTNNISGCTDVNMKKGLDTLGVPYKRILNQPTEKSISDLTEALNNNYPVILRTLTKEIKHWIVVYGLHNNIFYCSDPWLGKITYTLEQIIDIWKPRQFDAFIVLDNGLNRPKVEKINTIDKPSIIEMVADEFKNVMSVEDSVKYLNKAVDWHISVKLVLNSKIIGCYLFSDTNQLPQYEGKKGVEGIALQILSEYRGMGYGKMLMSYSECLPYDYIHGLHLKGLHNIENWKKRRDIVYDNGDDCWVSVKMLK